MVALRRRGRAVGRSCGIMRGLVTAVVAAAPGPSPGCAVWSPRPQTPPMPPLLPPGGPVHLAGPSGPPRRLLLLLLPLGLHQALAPSQRAPPTPDRGLRLARCLPLPPPPPPRSRILGTQGGRRCWWSPWAASLSSRLAVARSFTALAGSTKEGGVVPISMTLLLMMLPPWPLPPRDSQHDCLPYSLSP